MLCYQFNYFYFRSRLTEAAKLRLPAEYIDIYERVWDESDYVIPPSENNAFFVMTNVVLTPNQTRTTCPEDPGELPDVICGYKNNATGEVNITQGVCVKGQAVFFSTIYCFCWYLPDLFLLFV